MVISTQAAFGRGTRKQLLVARTNRLGVNYLGHSYETRLLFAGMPKKIYGDNEDVFHSTLVEYARQFNVLSTEGFLAGDGSKMFMANLGLLADWPALTKAGKLERHFNNVQKMLTKSKPHIGRGICHICLGGKGPVKWECMAVDSNWMATIGAEEAWSEPGALLSIAKYKETWKAYKFDIWHNGAMGVANTHVASTLAVFLVDLVEANNVDAKIGVLNDHLMEYLAKNSLSVSFSELTKNILGFPTLASFPYGKWSKASDSVILSQWMEKLLMDPAWAHEVDRHIVLSIALQATTKYNALMSALHREGYFIFGERAVRLGAIGMSFMQDLQYLADVCSRHKLNRYYLQPKTHAMQHSWYFLVKQGLKAGVAINPLAESCPMSEDFIGKFSRQSRRVSSRTVMSRSLEAYLIKLRSVWNSHSDDLDA